MSPLPKDPAVLEELVQLLRQVVGPLEFGSIELIFHQGKLVQLEKHEKVRFEKN